MFIQLQPQHLTICELELELDFPFGRRPLVHAIEARIVLVNNAMVVLASRW